MPTSLTSTGVQFPDNTVQTTAASGSAGVQTKGYFTRILVSGVTYTPSSSVNRFWVFVFGSSSYGHTQSVGAPGGSGYAEKLYSSPSGSYSYSIGARAYRASSGSTIFDTITVTGAQYRTDTNGGNPGFATGGDFNARGGYGGSTSATAYAGIGGPGTRAGIGGNGGNSIGSTGAGAGGTGGNNASGSTGGAAAIFTSGSALSLPWNPIEYYAAGGWGSSNNSGNRAPGGLFWTTASIVAPVFLVPGTVNNAFNSNNPPNYGNGAFSDYYAGPVFGHGVNIYGNIVTGPISNIGGNGFIIIIEELK
jgi:hypothetical protein